MYRPKFILSQSVLTRVFHFIRFLLMLQNEKITSHIHPVSLNSNVLITVLCKMDESGWRCIGNDLLCRFWEYEKKGGYVTYWVLRNYLKPDKFGMLSGKTYYQGDCKLFRYKSLSGSFHKEPMGGGSSINYSPKNPDWKYPPSNSVIEEILKSYCSSEV